MTSRVRRNDVMRQTQNWTNRPTIEFSGRLLSRDHPFATASLNQSSSVAGKPARRKQTGIIGVYESSTSYFAHTLLAQALYM